MTEPPLATAPVRTAAELLSHWKTLLGEPTFAARSLWLAWLDDGVMVPVVIPVDDVPAVPDRPMLANLAHVCRSVTESHVTGSAHLAMALCRPGRPAVSPDDQAWERGLREAFRGEGGTWSLHLAAGGSIVPMVDLPS